MTSSSSTRRSRLITTCVAIVIAIGAWTVAAGQCHSTGVVMVRFDPPNVKADQFRIRLKTKKWEKDVTVTKDGKVWREDVETFDIAGSQLLWAEVPGLRTACNIAPEKNFKIARKCVAMFVVTADPLWDLNVDSNRDGEQFRYKLDSRIAACDRPAQDFEPAATPRSIIDIGTSDKVIVAVQRRESFISVMITQSVLRQYRGKAKFSQLDPIPTTQTPVRSYARHLKQAQADKNRDLTFSAAPAPAGGGG